MRWTLKPKADPDKIKFLSEVLKIPPTISSLLVQRGIETYEEAEHFFRPKLSHLHDPYLMKDMEKAVQRIETAIENRERIMVYGDYDVDGTTSVALVSSFLKTFYPDVCTYIPDRYDEGYGVSYKGIDFAEDNEVSLIIALDCGVKAVDKVDYATQKNIDFIICDHHRPGEILPKAVAVLDPKRNDCHYPYKELCGCGVGFKLVQALGANRGMKIDDLLLYLDLVVTAIGADIVPITGENRVLAHYGLKVLNSNPRTGFNAILRQLKKESLSITDVVFIIAPRINAAGRMKHGNHAVQLLVEDNLESAIEFASEIEAFNTERRDTDQKITEEALAQILENNEEDRFTTVVYHSNWHKGVIGIVASRLTETYYRPTVVFTESGDKLAASVRSVKGFDVYEALESCSEYMLQFGGHKYAAGLTLEKNQYEAFKSRFEEVVKNSIDPMLLTPEIRIDGSLELSEISSRFYRIIKQFAPFGPGNMSPVFMSENLIETGAGRCVGSDKTHLRLVVRQGSSALFTCIGFGLGDKIEIACIGKPFKAAYSIDENHWQGNTSLQLKLRDIKP